MKDKKEIKDIIDELNDKIKEKLGVEASIDISIHRLGEEKAIELSEIVSDDFKAKLFRDSNTDKETGVHAEWIKIHYKNAEFIAFF